MMFRIPQIEPIKIWVFVLNFEWDVTGCFPNDLKIPNDRVLCFVIGIKLFKCHVLGIGFYLSNASQNIINTHSPISFR